MNTSFLISGRSAGVAGTAPKEIVFLPEGSFRITPQSHPQGIFVKITPENGPGIVAKFNQTLQKRLSENVKPWLDFEHTGRYPASGYPTAFRYEPGQGIMAAVEWSGSGKTAIENKDVRYFSPEFYVDANGTPAGIPEKGALGGLVTEPAFRNIEPVAASVTERQLSAYEKVHAHIAAELGEEGEAVPSSADLTETSELSPYEKVSAHFAKELGEEEEMNRKKAEMIKAKQAEYAAAASGLSVRDRIEAHFAAELGESFG